MIYFVERINRLLVAVETKFKNFELKMSNKESQLKSQSQRGALIFIKLVTFTVFSVHVTYFISSKCYLPFSETKTMYFDIVLPFRSDSIFYYYYAFTFETVVVVIEGLINISSIVIAVGFVHILCYEMDIFGIIMENMSDLISQKGMHRKNSENRRSECNLGIYRVFEDKSEMANLECRNTHCKHIVKEIVDHHSYLISLMNDVQSILSFIVLDMFVTCEFMLCLCSFQIYQIYSTTSFVSLMKNICMLAALIVHEFVYFFFGQRLVSKTQDLHRSVYFCEWYNETKSFKNSMNIVHLRMNKPFTILAGKIIPVTLASFITMFVGLHWS
ncbi:hypothetical protein LSTR_LSTR001635 [Laodelphax striatellus]|uniref:Odorant receptor n=1 Tax=Laodelphax striatellus TaxID=195883 RepID=A0A482XC09_LAOST|nr:hypothetical protein LSTR_LSTR001635 [Laodelphax striatellus]